MYATLTTLIDRFESHELSASGVLDWGSPVPVFGDLSNSGVATLGLNPSNREFVDEEGDELEGVERRFHTLRSLSLDSWLDVDSRHLSLIIESCRTYFQSNPYDRWFGRLDQIVAGANKSFYDTSATACHLDLIPYATTRKWTHLDTREREALMLAAGDTLGMLLRDSPVRLLILNGRSVVDRFERISGVRLKVNEMPSWNLPRRSGRSVLGLAFHGEVDAIASTALGYRLHVLGYNHNLQSSFGVTTAVVRSIRSWIATASTRALR